MGEKRIGIENTIIIIAAVTAVIITQFSGCKDSVVILSMFIGLFLGRLSVRQKQRK